MSDISVDSSQRHGSLFSLGEDDDGRSAPLFLGEGSSAGKESRRLFARFIDGSYFMGRISLAILFYCLRKVPFG